METAYMRKAFHGLWHIIRSGRSEGTKMSGFMSKVKYGNESVVNETD